jgi:hypothetical protein
MKDPENKDRNSSEIIVHVNEEGKITATFNTKNKRITIEEF